jgi:hypothetical protein
VKTLAGEKLRWLAAGFATTIIGFGLLFWFEVPSASTDHAAGSSRFETLVVQRVVADEAALLDKTPLFLPTSWNTSIKDVSLPATGGVFADFPSAFAYKEGDHSFGVFRSDQEGLNGAILDIEGPNSAFLSFGQKAQNLQVTRRAVGYLEVYSAKDGIAVIREALTLDLPPGTINWSPIELMAVVSAAGLVGPPVSITLSGLEEVDLYFADFLVKVFRIGEKLSPGVYRIIVGP